MKLKITAEIKSNSQPVLVEMSLVALVLLQSLSVALAALAAQVKCPKLCSSCPCVQGAALISGVFSYPYEAYLGVPYAEKPINELRFKNPKPLQTYPKVLVGDKQKCVQRNIFLWQLQISGNEDCLYMNIYRSTVSRRSNTFPGNVKFELIYFRSSATQSLCPYWSTSRTATCCTVAANPGTWLPTG
jgi:Carboxylesterase family